MAAVDYLVDCPELGVLPQRVPIDAMQLQNSTSASVIAHLQEFLEYADGTKVVIPPEYEVLVAECTGEFTPLANAVARSMLGDKLHFSKIRLAAPQLTSIVVPQVEGSQQKDSFSDTASPPPTPAVVPSKGVALADDAGTPAETMSEVALPTAPLPEALHVILEVVKAVVSEAVSCTPEGFTIDARTIDVFLADVQRGQHANTCVTTSDATVQQLYDSILCGYRVGSSNRSRVSAHTAPASATEELVKERDDLRSRLNRALDQVEQLQNCLASRERVTNRLMSPPGDLRSPTIGARAPPCTPACNQSGTPAQSASPLPEAIALTRSLDEAANDTVSDGTKPAEAAVVHAAPSAIAENNDTETAAKESPPHQAEDSIAAPTDADAATATEEDAVLTDAKRCATLVSVFYNEFDYVSKTTRKKGRAVSLRATKDSTLFDALCRAVAATFHEGLKVGYYHSDGTRVAVETPEQLDAYLSACQERGVEPVLQCYSCEEENEWTDRSSIGSSPKKLFVRSPAAPRIEGAPRPTSATLRQVTVTPQRRERPVSAMSVKPLTPSNTPYDYIAGTSLDDCTIAREFQIISRGDDEVSKEDVLAYLEARYDTVGQPRRFAKLLDSLCMRSGRKSAMLNVDEFAIVLLRVSQS